ncbi:hypothetical protein ACFFQW_33060 [Umezawaea endophytica]|uniref:Uncharacterized protein n=1 Tax=Umezawaea endophytica TaxID=1654476 RepID=A0A9X2VSW5_9PSEU|nr:hypothetical protein [Umezawaea endophytica]MCS7482271.1 hypothetical protein [Umezawaea endophytica]
MDDLVELGLAEGDTDTEADAEAGHDEPSAARDSRAGFAGSVVALVVAAVAAVALLAWLVLFWLAPPLLAWLDSHGL